MEYLAGLMDGEGTFTLKGCQSTLADGTRIRRAVPGLKMSNTDKRLVDVMNERWPSTIVFLQNPGRNGSNQKNHKNIWLWEANTTTATVICEQLMPFLVSKKEQALIVMTMGKIGGVRNKNRKGRARAKPDWLLLLEDFAVNRIRELNKRGVDCPSLIHGET